MREENLRKGPWYEEEDERLKAFVAVLGERRWDSIAKASGLRRSGKSCRLRWLNYLRPCLKQGPITPDEEQIILQLHEKWGNKWAKIARRLPGRTDNEIKNYWRTYLRKKMQIQTQIQNAKHYFPFPLINIVSSLESSSSSDETNNSNQDASLSQEVYTITREVNSNDDNKGVFGVNPTGLSDYTITSSPYEDRLSLGYWGSNGSEVCFDYPITWSLGDSNAWDCLDTLWDMDLFCVNS